MAAKWGVAVVLLAILVGFKLSNNETQTLPSWPMYSLSLLLQKMIHWLDQTITPPELWLLKTMTGFTISKGIYIACELEIADLLAKGPLSSSELAKLAGTDPARTERVMKFLAVHGVFERTVSGIYANTAASEYLRKDHPRSERALFIHFGYEITMMFQKYLEALYDPSLKPFSAAFNSDKDIWEIMNDPANIKMKTNFDKAMVGGSMHSLPSTVQDFPWSRCPNATVVDVGGGLGHITAEVLRANPSFKGVIFDLEKAIEGAKVYLPTVYPDVSPRITLVSGSFFERIVPGGDYYILRFILHDWSDEDSVKILKTVARALEETQKTSSKRPSVLIIEHLYDYPPVHTQVAFADMVMLGILGKERSTSEIEGNLLEKAGLKLVQVHQIRSQISILEAQLA